MPDQLSEMKIKLVGRWDEKMLETVHQVFEDIAVLLGAEAAADAFSGVRIRYIGSKKFGEWGIRSFAPPPPILSTLLGADVVLVNAQPKYTIAHELGHVWDYRKNYKLSEGLMDELGTRKKDAKTGKYDWQPYPCPEPYPGTALVAGNEIPTRKGLPTPYAATKGGGGGLNAIATKLTRPGMEDWAESFASLLYPEHYPSYNCCAVTPGGIREKYVRSRVKRFGR